MGTIAEAKGAASIGFFNRTVGALFDNPKNLFLETTPKKFLLDGIFIHCKNQETYIMPGERPLKYVCDQIEKDAPVQLQKQKDGPFKFSLLTYVRIYKSISDS